MPEETEVGIDVRTPVLLGGPEGTGSNGRPERLESERAALGGAAAEPVPQDGEIPGSTGELVDHRGDPADGADHQTADQPPPPAGPRTPGQSQTGAEEDQPDGRGSEFEVCLGRDRSSSHQDGPPSQPPGGDGDGENGGGDEPNEADGDVPGRIDDDKSLGGGDDGVGDHHDAGRSRPPEGPGGLHGQRHTDQAQQGRAPEDAVNGIHTDGKGKEPEEERPGVVDGMDRTTGLGELADQGRMSGKDSPCSLGDDGVVTGG